MFKNHYNQQQQTDHPKCFGDRGSEADTTHRNKQVTRGTGKQQLWQHINLSCRPGTDVNDLCCFTCSLLSLHDFENSGSSWTCANKGNEPCSLSTIDSFPHVLHTDLWPTQAWGQSVQPNYFLFIQTYLEPVARSLFIFFSSSFSYLNDTIILTTISLSIHRCVLKWIPGSEFKTVCLVDIGLNEDLEERRKGSSFTTHQSAWKVERLFDIEQQSICRHNSWT